jgi:hypothetical protein
MTRWRLIAILFLCFACTHNQKKPTVSGRPEPSLAKPSEVPKDLAENEAVVLTEDFRVPLLDWMKRNPRANYAKLAKEIQKYIKTHGLIYYVNIKELEERDNKFQRLALKDGTTLLFDTATGSEGPCGEYFVPVSVAGFSDGRIIFLTSHGPKTLERDTKGLLLERTIIHRFPGESVTFYLPTSDIPWNVSTDGKYVAWKYDLKMSLVENWWRTVVRRFRDLREERPFALIRISQGDFVVETNERALGPGQYEQVPSDVEGVLRYAYKPRGVSADVAEGCR